MQQPAWGLTLVLLAVLNVYFSQAATIGTSTTGSVAVLTASAEVRVSTCNTVPKKDHAACTVGNESLERILRLVCGLQVSYRVGTGGSCGFGPIGDPYPDSAILSIRSSSPVVAKLPESGCGACIQLTCSDQVGIH